MTDAVKPLTDADVEHARELPNNLSYTNARWVATLDALKATPSQSDVAEDEELREYVKHHVVKTWNAWRLHQTEPSAMVEMLADVFMHILEDRIAASRGTRTLTEEERGTLARVHAMEAQHASIPIYFAVRMRAIISRLSDKTEPQP